MKLREVYERIDARYPKRLSDDYVARYGGHDNSGILLMDADAEIAGALFSLDLSLGAIAAAKEKGMNLIVTHHPALFFPVANIRTDDALGARLHACLRAGIGVVSMHLNLDCAVGGIDEHLARAAGAVGEMGIGEPLPAGGGYGRVYAVEPSPLSAFAAKLGEALGTRRVFVYGDPDTKISRAASFCGAGLDGSAIAAAKSRGAQAVVSADIKHNFICDALESGLCVVQLTHYASENYGFRKIYQSLGAELGVPCAFYQDAQML